VSANFSLLIIAKDDICHLQAKEQKKPTAFATVGCEYASLLMDSNLQTTSHRGPFVEPPPTEIRIRITRESRADRIAETDGRISRAEKVGKNDFVSEGHHSEQDLDLIAPVVKEKNWRLRKAWIQAPAGMTDAIASLGPARK